MATWSFNPTLPSDKITTAETNGKLVITVLSGKFTSDTAYTVTYNDGNGCSASTKFYIKNDCSGGGGGGTESAYINLNIRNYLDHDVYINGENIIYVSASTSDNRIGVKMNIKNRSSECAMFKIPKMTNNIPGEIGFSYSDIDFTVNWDGHNMSSVYGKPYTTDTPKVYTYLCNTTTDCSKRDGSHNSDKIIMSQLEGNFPNTPTSSNPATITLTIDNDNGDERDYYKCEGGCSIEGKVLAATDSGEQSIGSLPTNGTWSFIPTHVDWLGDISQVGTNVMASNVITNDGNSRYVVFTGTCADCSDCTGTHTFKVTQNGTSVECSATGINTNIPATGGSNEFVGTYTTECDVQNIEFDNEGTDIASQFAYSNGEIYASVSPNLNADERGGKYKVTFTNGATDDFHVWQDGTGGGGGEWCDRKYVQITLNITAPDTLRNLSKLIIENNEIQIEMATLYMHDNCNSYGDGYGVPFGKYGEYTMIPLGGSKSVTYKIYKDDGQSSQLETADNIGTYFTSSQKDHIIYVKGVDGDGNVNPHIGQYLSCDGLDGEIFQNNGVYNVTLKKHKDYDNS